jgi:hypothetical protein
MLENLSDVTFYVNHSATASLRRYARECVRLFILPLFCSMTFDFRFKKLRREDEKGEKHDEKGK